MLRIAGVTMLLLQVGCGAGAGFDWCTLTCGQDQHTMCAYQAGGGDACKDYKRGLTAEEKQVIVDYHNQLRAKVANGQETSGPQPSASDMNQLVWDDEVAEIAQRWVEQCEQKSSHDKCRITKDQVKVGQNFAASSGYGMAVDRIATIKQLIQSWYDEVKSMNPSLVDAMQNTGGVVIGHYTQLVWGKTTRLGCGLAHKQEGEKGTFNVRLICNYKIAGNFITQPIYTKGDPASACAKKSTKYPGLCEPQEQGDTTESDPSVPTSPAGDSPGDSSSDGSTSGDSTPGDSTPGDSPPGDSPLDDSPSSGSPSGGATPGSSKPVAVASSGFGKPASAFASAGFPSAFASAGIQQAPSAGSGPGNPTGKLGLMSLSQLLGPVNRPGGSFNSPLLLMPNVKGAKKGNSPLQQYFNSLTIPGLSSGSPNTKVNTFYSGQISPSDLQALLRRFDQNS